MPYRQGKSFSPPAQGAGYLLIIIGFSPFFLSGHFELFESEGLLYGVPLMFFGCWIGFSTTIIDFSEVSKGFIIRRYGLFFCKLRTKVNLKKYDAAIIKKVSVVYRVGQGMGEGLSLAQGEHKETFVGLFLKYKGNFEEELLMKGMRTEIMDVMKDELADTHLRFFEAAIRSDMELKFETTP